LVGIRLRQNAHRRQSAGRSFCLGLRLGHSSREAVCLCLECTAESSLLKSKDSTGVDCDARRTDKRSNTLILMFSGKWHDPLEQMFIATSINFKDDLFYSDHYVLSINKIQINPSYRYKRKTGRTFYYRLIIQRSTGRFSEKFTEDQAACSSLEYDGHCSRLSFTGSKPKKDWIQQP